MTPVVLLLKGLHLKKYKKTVNKMTIIVGYIDPWRLAAVEKMPESFFSLPSPAVVNRRTDNAMPKIKVQEENNNLQNITQKTKDWAT
jgi:hypothetical protein